MKDGYKVWEGTNNEVLGSTNADVEEYVFKSKLFKQVRVALRK